MIGAPAVTGSAHAGVAGIAPEKTTAMASASARVRDIQDLTNDMQLQWRRSTLCGEIPPI